VPHKFLVLAIDRKTGKTVWEQNPINSAPHEGYHRMYGSFASNSPVTDGKLLFTPFGSRGVYAYSLDGKPAWKKDFGVQMRTKLQFGEGAPPALHGKYLLLKFDQESGSFLAALDKNTGNEIWRVERDEATSWSGPLVIEHGGKTQVIVSASTKTRAYDITDGKVIWECAGLGANVIPMPVYKDGVVYVMSGYRDPNMLAIRLGKTGDLTGTDSILWTNQRGNSYTASPVLYEDRLYFITDNGMVSCFDIKTGQPLFHQIRLPKAYNFKASPVAAGGKLYLATENEDVVVLELGKEFNVLATNTLAGQSFISSPVVADGEIYLRSRTHLFCIA
jgi:outer membrane protein assembly factor BamB